MTSLLGIDPGSKRAAWCRLEATGLRAAWTAHGYVPATTSGARELVDMWRGSVDLVVIERPTWIAIAEAGGPLIDTAWAGGIFAGAFAGVVPVEEILMRDWRSFLCGRQRGGGTASDAMVGTAILARVAGVPKRTSNHHRDAAGAALVGALRWQSIRKTA